MQKILEDFPDEQAIIWHDVINKSITEHSTNFPEALTADELLHKIRARPQIVGIVNCKRDGADDMLSDLKKLSIPVDNVPTDIISRLKQKSAELIDHLRELQQKHEYKLHSLNIIGNNNFDLKSLLNKKRKPTAKQRAAKRQKLAENQDESLVSTRFG